ncbi:uncharacterized protein METZ01_LOCUS509254, partial [marine metagenome]
MEEEKSRSEVGPLEGLEGEQLKL